MTDRATLKQNKELQISYLTLRKAIGWLGMLLPFALLIGNYCINQLDLLNNPWFIKTDCYGTYVPNGSFKNSISHYYYSSVGELFTGTLGAVALFMFCYKGHPKRRSERGLSDGVMTNLTAFFALGLVVFPASTDQCISDNMRIFLSSQHTGYIHFTFAALFFISLALMSIINFRRTETVANFGKGSNSTLYLWCGITILVCLVIIVIYASLFQGHYPGLDKFRPVFVFEAIALIAFGLSWLTKGKINFYYIPKKLNIKK